VVFAYRSDQAGFCLAVERSGLIVSDPFCSGDEVMIQRKLFTTENTKDTEKRILLTQPIRISVFSVSSVVTLGFFFIASSAWGSVHS